MTRCEKKSRVRCTVHTPVGHKESLIPGSEILQPFFCDNQAIRPNWTVPSKIQKSSMEKDSNTTPIPSCNQDVRFLDLSPNMGCDFVVVFAGWDEFSHSPPDFLHKRFLIRTASA